MTRPLAHDSRRTVADRCSTAGSTGKRRRHGTSQRRTSQGRPVPARRADATRLPLHRPRCESGYAQRDEIDRWDLLPPVVLFSTRCTFKRPAPIFPEAANQIERVPVTPEARTGDLTSQRRVWSGVWVGRAEPPSAESLPPRDCDVTWSQPARARGCCDTGGWKSRLRVTECDFFSPYR